MGWIRTCDICKNVVEIDQRRIIKFKKISILGFKGNQFFLEKEYPKNEIVVCEFCRNRSIKELWNIVLHF